MVTHSEEVQRQLDFVNNTVQMLISQGGRSVNEETDLCVYKHESGRACAVGLWFKDEVDTLSLEGKSVLAPEIADNLNNLLKEEARGIPLDLLDTIQYLHDESGNWKEEKLTENGKEFLEEIIDAIKDGVYTNKIEDGSDYI